MRIAMLSAAPVNAHGWGRYTRDLIQALTSVEPGHAVEIVLITSVDAPVQPDAELPVVAYHRVLPSLTPAPRFSTARLLAVLPAVQRQLHDCDLVHITAEPYVLAAPFTARRIITAHGTYVPQTVKRAGSGWLYRRAYASAHITCVSSFTARQVRGVLPSADVSVITNGVNAERYRQPGTRPAKMGPTVLAVGQLKPRKGYHILAAAMRIVREKVPDAQAIFIGDTSEQSYVSRLEKQITADGLENAIHLLGRVPDDVLLGWYHAADVFALPALNIGSRFEGFGLVYLEASAAGLPVVGTIGCGAEDAIRQDETGLLVPQNDVPATAQAVIHLLRDSVLRRRMSEEGQAFANQNTWHQVALRMLALYRNITGNGSGTEYQ